MRTVRFVDASGTPVTGRWTDQGIEYAGEVYDPADVTIQYPTEPTKVLGVGPNYVSNAEDKDLEWPERPADLTLFVKTVPNSLVSHGGTAVLRGDGEFIHELELGIVIEEPCRGISAAEAEEVIGGYTCVNEITNMVVPECRYDAVNWVRKKAIDDSAPAGPVVASPDVVPEDAAMELRVNGEVRQQTTRDRQIFSEAEVVAEISQYLTLYPGDLIATGSPINTTEMVDDDEIEVEIEGIGTLEHDVRIER